MERPTVMIVATSPFHLALMGDLLEANDIKTIRASSAKDALATARDERPILAVLDLDLPPEESRRLMASFGNRSSNDSLPFMVVGDRGQHEAFANIVAACESITLEKPIDTGVFPRRVIQEIRRHTTGISREALL